MPLLDDIGLLRAHDFMGKDGFVWFIGQVVDVRDPLEFGRARVRIFGTHSFDDSVLPTEHLPWAQALAPLGNAEAPKSPPIGTFVVGFFLDGQLAQQPVMLGCLSGKRHKETLRNNQ